MRPASLARCPAHSGSLWLTLALSGSLWLSLALSGSLWLSLARSGSLWLSIALRICLQSPCLAHKALAWLAASLLRYNTLVSPDFGYNGQMLLGREILVSRTSSICLSHFHLTRKVIMMGLKQCTMQKL